MKVRVLTAAVLGSGVLGLSMLLPAVASAAPTPSPTCKVPVFSVAPLSAAPGSKVTVSGVNFSGCTAQGSTATPTPVLTVKVGVQSAASTGQVLATTTTTATGTFSVQITVPPLASGGVPKLALAAQATDPATGLSYTGVAVLAYSTGGTPTGVPAGSGGQAGTTSGGTRYEQDILALAGVALLGAAGVGFTRRRSHGARS